MPDSLRPHESQHARPLCPSQTPGVCSNTCPSSWWCHPAISSSVDPFSSCPQSLPASGSFPMSQLFEWGDQTIGVSTSASVLPMNTQDWSTLGRTGWSPCSPRDSQESSPTPHNSYFSTETYRLCIFKKIRQYLQELFWNYKSKQQRKVLPLILRLDVTWRQSKAKTIIVSLTHRCTSPSVQGCTWWMYGSCFISLIDPPSILFFPRSSNYEHSL